MLEVKDVSKKYGKLMANNHLSFTLEDGMVGILLGPNGAGKSTIFKSIAGLLRYDGEITINGYVNKTSEARAALGFVPEIPAMYPNLTVEEHLDFIARAYRLKDYEERKEALLRRFELDDKRRKFGDELSKGMQQKLSICCALLTDPKLIILDEPLVGLDPHAIKELKKTFEELKAQGTTVLISTHMIESVDMIWDKAFIMYRGELLATLTKAELDAQGVSLEDRFFELTEGGREE